MNNQTENKRHLFRGFCPDKPYQTKVGKDTIMINGQVIHGEWVKGYLKNANTIDTYRETEIDGQIYEVFDYSSIVIPKTVGQWVMTDKDGKDVFVGDRMAFKNPSYENVETGEVIYDEEDLSFELIHDNDKLWDLFGYADEFYELIGNKWEVKQ